ncbi:hypothetical protein [Algoriphagus namhaensis]
MSVLAKYSFLPWVRLGLGNEIKESDFLGNAVPANAAVERPEIEVVAQVKASKGEVFQSRPIPKTVKVQGPGDVLGINASSIIREHPKKGVRNFETNNLAYLEFYEEDLPWRFTPAKPVGNKLRPWLYLALLREDEFEKGTGGTPTPFITIKSDALAKVFCHEKDTYALAHVHVLEDLGDNAANASSLLAAKLAQNPDLALSRVLSPRKLEYTPPVPGQKKDPNVYHAFLIPAFETGRLAGLGLATTDIPAQKSSWSQGEITGGSNPGTYPYYYTWSFRVDSGGDFETLAELLTARELPENIGKREMDMSNMGFGIKPVGDDALGYVEGAMRHPDYVTAPWPMSDQSLKEELRNVLNLSFNLQDTMSSFNQAFFYSPAVEEDPIVVPPTYGKWHQGLLSLRANGQDWVHRLNLHPSNRAAAGLGVQVVQKHQEKFMEMAWEQIGEINEANQKIRETELMKRASQSLAVKKVFKLNEFDLVNATGKAFEVLKLDPGKTIKGAVSKSTVPTAVRSGTFMKVAKNFTPKPKLQVDATLSKKLELNTTFFQKMNQPEGSFEKISAAPKKKEPAMILPAVETFAAINFAVANPVKSFMERLTEAILAVNSLNFTTQAVLNKMSYKEGTEAQTEEQARAKAILDAAKKPAKKSANYAFEIAIGADVFEERISGSFNEAIYGESKKVLFKKDAAVEAVIQLDHSLVVKTRFEYLESFQTKFIKGSGDAIQSNITIRPQRALLPMDLAASIRSKLNPALNFSRKLSSFFAANYANNNKPIMAYPRFPMPMYDYLKEISADYIIPNVSEIQPNTITLMETNREFIESFLMGMNHEFSRELLWREFPTDMRGSYFRHFWEYDNDPSAEKAPGETVEEYVDRILHEQNIKADIEEIHKWKKPLGKNEVKPGPDLVLLIKGDLLRKYPNTLVYAQKAAYKNGNRNLPRVLGADNTILWPVISGKMEPDVYFFGFELSQEEANGNRTGNPGYFFVLRERPGQISFGLDDLNGTLNMSFNSWDKVTWEHTTGNPSVKPPYLKVQGVPPAFKKDAEGPSPAAQWGASSSDMAYILYQSPILFARHASTMLND